MRKRFIVSLLVIISILPTWSADYYSLKHKTADEVELTLNVYYADNHAEIVKATSAWSIYSSHPSQIDFNIPSEVDGHIITTVCDEAFKECYWLKSVYVPNNITTIGEKAFYYCGSLEEVVLTDNVEVLGANSFGLCTNLKKVTFGTGVNTVGANAFLNCNKLEGVYITDLKSWCEISFEGTSVTNPLKAAGHLYLNEQEVTELTIPDGVTSIEKQAFWGGMYITSIEIPEGVTYIDNLGFSGCISAKSLILPSTLQSIGWGAFSADSLITTVRIPQNVIEIDDAAFESCDGLIEVITENPIPVNIGSYTFTNRKKATLYVPFGSKKAYEDADYWNEFNTIIEMPAPSSTIEFADADVKALCVQNWDTDGDGELSEAEAAAVENLGHIFSDYASKMNGYVSPVITSFNELQYFTGLTKISDGAFFCCGDLEEVILPISLLSIGEGAFSGCSSLRSISIPSKVSVVDNQAFEGCSNLTSIILPEGVTRIGGGAFAGCTRLESISLPESLITMSEAFSGCTNLKSITIPKSVQYVSAFPGCTALETVIVDTGNPYFDSRNNCNAIIETATNKLIAGCYSTVIPESVTAIGQMAFAGFEMLDDIQIPESVVSIGFDAFAETLWYNSQPSGLVYAGKVAYRVKEDEKGSKDTCTSIVLEEGTKGIADYAFGGCHELISLVIPEGLTHIGSSAFSECYKLSSIDFPSTVWSIGYGVTETPWYTNQAEGPLYIGKCLYAYKGNKQELETLIIKEGTMAIGPSAFSNSKALKTVYLPKSLKVIGGVAFNKCTALTAIDIPYGVKCIGEDAFSGCSALQSVSIPASVHSIGYRAFGKSDAMPMSDCSELISVTVGMELPIAIYQNVFSNSANATLYVPKGCKDVYEETDYWNDFKEIVEKENIDILFDENATALPSYTAGEKVNVTMLRTINAGEWSTIVLPFTLTKTQVGTVFGNDVELAEFTGFSATYDDIHSSVPTSITIHLNPNKLYEISPMLGGTPYLIKVSQNIDSFQANDVTLVDAINEVTKEDKYETTGKLTGTFVKTKIPEDGLFLSGNQFWYSTGNTTVKAFRCWFELGAVLDKETDFGARVMLNFMDDESTGISAITDYKQESNAYYNLSGQRVESLKRKGLYIRDGKKVIKK